MSLIYKPFGLIAGILAGLVARRLFSALWGVVDDEEPPEPTTERASWPRVLGAAAMEGLTFSVVKAAVDRAGARGFQHLTGAWPGDREPDPA